MSNVVYPDFRKAVPIEVFKDFTAKEFADHSIVDLIGWLEKMDTNDESNRIAIDKAHTIIGLADLGI